MITMALPMPAQVSHMRRRAARLAGLAAAVRRSPAAEVPPGAAPAGAVLRDPAGAVLRDPAGAVLRDPAGAVPRDPAGASGVGGALTCAVAGAAPGGGAGISPAALISLLIVPRSSVS
jgi:hypothetical protein